MSHKKYGLIYCDPPWDYKNKVSNGATKNHYSTPSFFNLTYLSIHSITSDNAVLIMWYTSNIATFDHKNNKLQAKNIGLDISLSR